MPGGGAVAREGEKAAEGLIAKAAESSLRDAEKVVAKDAVDRAETKTVHQIEEEETTRLIGKLSEGDKEAIKGLYDRAGKAENGITSKLKNVEDAVGGAELAGIKYSKKQLGSLTRKVADDLDRHPGKTLDEALRDVNDAVRYTFKMGRDDYARATNELIQKMKDEGFQLVEKDAAGKDLFKNFWDRAGYKGINSTWRDPATGQIFEMQFHTFESLAAKEGTHGIYDFARLPGFGHLKDTLDGLQNRVFDKVTRPPGISAINH